MQISVEPPLPYLDCQLLESSNRPAPGGSCLCSGSISLLYNRSPPRCTVCSTVLYSVQCTGSTHTHTHNCFLRPSLLSVRVRQSGWEHVWQDFRRRRDVKRINAMWNKSEFVNTGMFKIISVQNYCTINYLVVTFWLVNLFYTHSGAKMC